MKKKFIAVFLIMCACILPARLSARAEKTITSISLEIENDIEIGEPCYDDNITVTPQNSGYEVWYIELLNSGKIWDEGAVPRFRLYLRGEDGNTFSIQKDRIKIKGAEMESGRPDLDPEDYILTVRLPSLHERTGEIAGAQWTGETTAAWSEAYNAASYEAQLLRDGKPLGSIHTVSGLSIDLGAFMKREGNYRFRVRAVNVWDPGKKSGWKETENVFHVDSATAERLRLQYPDSAVTGEGPGTQTVDYGDQYGWIAEGGQWWYRNPDGSYTTDNWQLIDDKWYFFDSKGYMATGWIQWKDDAYYCDPVSGAMLTDTIVPDGMGCRVDSSGAWIR